MHSPVKEQDRKLYQEIIATMQALTNHLYSPVAIEALQGFHIVLDALKHKINNHDYTSEDQSFIRFDLS